MKAAVDCFNVTFWDALDKVGGVAVQPMNPQLTRSA
jgi:hypothetical protein